MIPRRLVILAILGTATILPQSSRIPFALAAFWRTGIMPPATRRKRMSSLSPVKSSFVSKGDVEKTLKPESQVVIPPKILSSSALFVTPPKPMAAPADSLTLLQTWANHSQADYHNFTEEEARGIRKALLEWYQDNRRKLPWRGDPPPFDGSTSGINSNAKKRGRSENNNNSNNNNAAAKKSKGDQKSITSFFSATATGKSDKIKSEPKASQTQSSAETLLDQAIPVTGYGVWVSEIMLQQTRVEAVIPFWIKWMKSFPTVYELAAATEDEVNAHWAGLGFYRRARYLHQGAKYVVQELNGELPTTTQGLSKITGIGPYTASAIASIAFGVCVPVVDGNVCRVLSRLKGIANHIKAPILKDRLGWKLAAQIVESGDGSSPGLVNQALMELGATYCAPAGSGIDERDPLRDYYLSTQLGRAYLAVLQEEGASELCDALSSLTRKSRKDSCELCAANGIEIVMEKFRQEIVANATTMEEAARIGHATFPMDPPKTEKREEDLAMAVLMNRPETGDTDSVRYLMVKRPKEGLLGGQWEFPNVCVQMRKKNKGKASSNAKAPGKGERDRALTKFLLEDIFLDYSNEELPDGLSNLSRTVCKEPLEHIFSHVKHYMWVEVADLIGINLKDDELEWTTPSGKEVRWMNQSDMKKVGITSGVKKVLQCVEKLSCGCSVVSKAKKKKRKV